MRREAGCFKVCGLGWWSGWGGGWFYSIVTYDIGCCYGDGISRYGNEWCEDEGSEERRLLGRVSEPLLEARLSASRNWFSATDSLYFRSISRSSFACDSQRKNTPRTREQCRWLECASYGSISWGNRHLGNSKPHPIEIHTAVGYLGASFCLTI